MLLSIRHRTSYRYAPAATGVALRLKLYPSRTAAQTPRSWSVTVNGDAPQTRITNGYGDEETLWVAQQPVQEVEVIAAGEVETRDAQGVLRGWSSIARPAMFLRRTALTTPDDAIRDLARSATAGLSGVAAAHALSNAVRDAVDYSSGVTKPATTAAEALRLGAGVCQDHAHLMIAAARSLGAAARYVVGYLLVGDDDSLDAGSETHAWTEIWADGLGWVGFDPANRICPTDRYVRLSAGLDAPDASPLRGSVSGASAETMEAGVQVTQSQQ